MRVSLGVAVKRILGILLLSLIYIPTFLDGYRVVSWPKNYIVGGQLKKVSFYVPQKKGSSKKFARNGELVIRPNAPATILIAHGYMCSMRDVSFLRWLFTKYNSLVFDFRAHGTKTPEQVCTFGHDEAYDVIAAVKFIRLHPELSNKPIIAYGFSMGSVAIIEAQAQEPDLFAARILDCPFDSSHELIKRGLSQLKFNLFGFEFPLPGRTLLQKYAFHPRVQGLLKFVLRAVANMDATPINTRILPLRPVESVKKVSVPSFFIHCKNDEKTPVESAIRIYNNAFGYKRLWLTNGRRHFDSYFNNPEKYAHKVDRFIQKVLSGAIKHKRQAKITEDSTE